MDIHTYRQTVMYDYKHTYLHTCIHFSLETYIILELSISIILRLAYFQYILISRISTLLEIWKSNNSRNMEIAHL